MVVIVVDTTIGILHDGGEMGAAPMVESRVNRSSILHTQYTAKMIVNGTYSCVQ